jgi:hypothetical protein
MVLSSRAAICGLVMSVLLDPVQHVLNVVSDVPPELEVGRASVGQSPVFQRAVGQPEQLNEFTLGQKRRSDKSDSAGTASYQSGP